MTHRSTFPILVSLCLGACGGSGSGGGGGGGGGGGINLAVFQPAGAIIGQSTTTGNTQNNGGGLANPNASGLEGPSGHVASGSLYVADTINNRVLGYAAIPTGLGASASFALGVPNFTTAGGGVPSATTLNRPASCWASGGALFVADRDNERVLIWNAVPTGNVAANVALGKPDLVSEGQLQGQAGLSTVTDVCVALGKVVVADFGNNRVMIWNSVPAASGTVANVVVGQPDFLTTSPGTTAAKMSQPTGVWTDGVRLVVSDSLNNRVLIWTTFPTVSGQAANLVVGQPDFVTSSAGTGALKMFNPWSVASDGSQLFVVDRGNQRVLIYSPFPTVSNPTPLRVLGQQTFTNTAFNDDDQNNVPDGNPTARTLFTPAGVTAIGNQLFVTDSDNHRVLIFTGS